MILLQETIRIIDWTGLGTLLTFVTASAATIISNGNRKGIKSLKNRVNEIDEGNKKDHEKIDENINELKSHNDEDVFIKLTADAKELVRDNDLEMLKFLETLKKSMCNNIKEIRLIVNRMTDDDINRMSKSALGTVISAASKLDDSYKRMWYKKYKKELDFITKEIRQIINDNLNNKYDAIKTILIHYFRKQLLLLTTTRQQYYGRIEK